MATLIDDPAEPIVVTRTIVVTPEPPDPEEPPDLDPAPVTVTIGFTADLTNPATDLDPAPVTTTVSLTATELIDATALDPAPVTATVGLTATELIDALVIGTASLATTISIAGALVDARVLLDPAPLALTVTVDADLSLQVAGHEDTAGALGLPAHVYHDYDPTRLVLRRAVVVGSKLGGFIVGKSKLGTANTVWQNIEAATVTINQSYTPDTTTYPTPPPKGPQVCFHTLLIEQDTASIALSYWDNPGPLLYPGDRIEVRYAGELLFWGTVDSTALTYAIDPEASKHGATRRVDFSATAAGTYAVMMGRIVKWKNLPANETAIKRIRRWVTVKGW